MSRKDCDDDDDFTVANSTNRGRSYALSGGTALRGVREILMKTESGVGSTVASDSLAKLCDFSRTSLESAYLVRSKSSHTSPSSIYLASLLKKLQQIFE